MTLQILIIEDDKLFSIFLKDKLFEYGEVITASSKNEALNLIDKTNFNIVFIDLDLTYRLEGLDILKKIAGQIYAVVLSSHDDDKLIERAYELGCQDYFKKGNEENNVKRVVSKYLNSRNDQWFLRFLDEDFITQDSETRSELEFVFKNSSSTIPIFFSGETGTGKTTIARLVHQASSRSGNFIQINCSEINPNLMESTLFGHVKGAFSGAISNQQGRIAMANKGTLFLDEICSMSYEAQTKLLKVIEEKSFYQVGGSKIQNSDFRILSASQEDIFEKIANGEFRQDLFYRLSGINVRLKPLRERPNDIPALISNYLNGKRRIVFKKCAIDSLKKQMWPGNIRELFRMIDVLTLKNKGIILKKDLPSELLKTEGAALIGAITNSAINKEGLNSAIYNTAINKGLKKTIRDIEKDIIITILAEKKQNVIATIDALKITRTKFYAVVGKKKERDV